MIERVYKRALSCRLAQKVLVATDDERIVQAVKAFGGQVLLTRPDHPSGTDRLAEVAERFADLDILVNVQGDEPLICPQAIDSAIAPLLTDNTIEMSTLARPLSSLTEAERPEQVKVVIDKNGFALYFSRAAIPYYRDACDISARTYLGHIGLYVYRRTCLAKLASLPPTDLEQAECLEQLRALEHGVKIKVVVSEYKSLAVDIPADIAAVEEALATCP